MTIVEIGAIVAACAAAAGIMFGLVQSRGQWFLGSSSLIKLQRETIDGLEEQIKRLEGEIAELREHLRCLEEAYRSSRLCARASYCQDYAPVSIAHPHEEQ